MTEERNGFNEEQTKAIIRAVLAGTDGGWVSENEIVQVANMLWEHDVAGQLVQMVLDGDMLVSLSGGELQFKPKAGAQ